MITAKARIANFGNLIMVPGSLHVANLDLHSPLQGVRIEKLTSESTA
jgi:hypothetical protein